MTAVSKPSAIVKRSVVIGGHKTSISIEEPFWLILKECAAANDQTLSAYIGAIDFGRDASNLSSTLRLHVLSAVVAERDFLRHRDASNTGKA